MLTSDYVINKQTDRRRNQIFELFDKISDDIGITDFVGDRTSHISHL